MNSSRKIKSVAELLALLGSPPRQKTVCMCHGTFDIVHPGHVRHLMYAKDHCDVLIASVTADKHVTKANYRPQISEQLRAMNLAAYEMVDYVLIDQEPTPLNNLSILKPDYFAKGFEYAQGHPKTDEERAVVERYGGSMLFTPGDVVYSSSAIINASPPNVAVENLAMTLEANGVTFEDLRAAVSNLAGLRVHVVGDTIVDTITQTTPTGGIGKTPTLSVQVQGFDNYIGGAAIVAAHLASAGAKVTFSSIVGDDLLGHYVFDKIKSLGVIPNFLFDHSRPTTNKNSIVAGGYRLLKIDTLDSRPISDVSRETLCRSIASTEADIVVFSDFRHGMFTPDTILVLSAAIPDGAMRVADSQVASRWGNILDFKGFDLITPNEKEARFALGDQDSVIRPLASRLYEEARCKTLILKMGERGALTQHAPVGDGTYLYAVGSFARSVSDPVGAGDALLAYAALARRATGSDLVASVLGSIAAGLECEMDGNIPITPDDILSRISELERVAQYGPLKESGRSISARSSVADLPSISKTRAAIVEARG